MNVQLDKNGNCLITIPAGDLNLVNPDISSTGKTAKVYNDVVVTDIAVGGQRANNRLKVGEPGKLAMRVRIFLEAGTDQRSSEDAKKDRQRQECRITGASILAGNPTPEGRALVEADMASNES